MATDDTAPVNVPPPSTQKPSKGRIVMYVTSGRDSDGYKIPTEVLPAIVVYVHGNDEMRVNLKVFTDAEHDLWLQDVDFDPNCSPVSWHWPPRVP